MKIKKRHTGLTLIEILVAVTIVAILAAGLYSVSDYLQKQSQIKLTESTIQTIVAALEQYYDFKGSFPFQADANYNDVNLVNDMGGNIMADNQCSTSATDHNSIYASSEVLYYFLNQIPASRKIENSINQSLITDKIAAKEYFIHIGTNCYPLIHIVDPWYTPFRYTYSTGDNFPVIESAGPDKDFNKTADNISSK